MKSLVQTIASEIEMSSLDLVEVTGKQHAHIMRDIRNEISELGIEVGQSIFGESSYINSQNKQQPCYTFGKDGAMQLALKYDAQTRYKVIQHINKLESQPRVLTEREQIIASMKLSIETSEEVNEIKEDVAMLKETMRIDSLQQRELQKKVSGVIVDLLGGKDSNAYQELSKKIFPSFWNEFKTHFGVPRYPDLPKVKFDEAIEFVGMWRPTTTLQIKIDNCNKQMKFQDDKELV